MACPRCGYPGFGGMRCSMCRFDMWEQPIQNYPEAIMEQQRFIQAQEKARMEQELHNSYISHLNDAIRFAIDAGMRGEKKPKKSLLGKYAGDKKLLLTRRVACN